MGSEIRKQAIKNAYLHHGKAEFSSVISKLIAENPDIKKNIKSIMEDVKNEISRINSLGIDKINRIVMEEFPEIMTREKKEEKHELPELENVEGKVVMRMAPSPSGPLHIGHSRMAILNDEYVKRYGGELILRIEDTNPNNIDPDAYDMIPQDLNWLGVNVTKKVIQSSRMDIYYNIARDMIRKGILYILEKDQAIFHDLKLKSIPAEERSYTPETNEEKFDKLLSGYYSEGEAAVVMKTDLAHPNPSVRDWIAFRINTAPHPLTGNKYILYPTMNFSVSADDHLLGLTHIIRGIDHLVNTEKQKYMFRANNWKIPEYYHYGFISIPDTILKTTVIKQGIKSGKYSGWDDIRLGTIMALKKRGYRPETFRKYWINSGMRESNATFSWEIFNSMNRELIDYDAKRFFFVKDPREVKLNNTNKLKSHAAIHPGRPELGYREYEINPKSSIYFPSGEFEKLKENDRIRLKDLCIVLKNEKEFKYMPEDNDKKLKIIQWVPLNSNDIKIYKPDGTVDDGKIEPLASGKKGVVQLERYGYVNLSEHMGFYLHR